MVAVSGKSLGPFFHDILGVQALGDQDPTVTACGLVSVQIAGRKLEHATELVGPADA